MIIILPGGAALCAVRLTEPGDRTERPANDDWQTRDYMNAVQDCNGSSISCHRLTGVPLHL